MSTSISGMLAEIIEDPDQLEQYLSRGGNDEILPGALISLLNKYATQIKMEPIRYMSTDTYLNYLKRILWAEDENEEVDTTFDEAVKDNMIYLLPYLALRKNRPAIHTHTGDEYDTPSQALVSAVHADNIEMAEVLLRLGADPQLAMQDAVKMKQQDMIDLMILPGMGRAGYLEKYTPLREHYRREQPWPMYRATGRPMTYMTSMCKRVGDTLPTSDEKTGGTHFYLPVVRYQSLYHEEREKGPYCGTFYFIDAESSVLLDLGKTVVFGSKVHALFALGRKVTVPVNEDIEINNILSMENWENAYNEIHQGIHPSLHQEHIDPSLRYFFDTVVVPYYFTVVRNATEVKKIPSLDSTPFYPTDPAKYWDDTMLTAGAHDSLDQKICIYARALGIDTIIIQREIGEYRVVTEILDTRDDTYCHLFRVKDAKSWYTPSKRYPAVWFTDNGFITDKGITHNFKIDTSDLNIVKI